MKLLLKGDNVKLRGLEPEDLEFLYTCENNTEVWQVSNTTTPFSKYILRQYIENSHHDIYTNKQLRLIICENNNESRQLGAIDLFDFDPYHMRAGVGILIHDAEDRNKGIAKEALQIVIKYCFKHLHFNQLYCNITNDNHKSIKLFEGVGFQKCAEKIQWVRTEKGWKDEFMYQLLSQEK